MRFNGSLPVPPCEATGTVALFYYGGETPVNIAAYCLQREAGGSVPNPNLSPHVLPTYFWSFARLAYISEEVRRRAAW